MRIKNSLPGLLSAISTAVCVRLVVCNTVVYVGVAPDAWAPIPDNILAPVAHERHSKVM